MKTLRETFEDETFDKLEAVKGDRTWREAITQQFGIDDGDAS